MKLKIFRDIYNGTMATEKLEQEINIWFEKYDPQIRSVSQTDTGAKFGLTICVWYKEKEKYKYGRDNHTGDPGLAEAPGYTDDNQGNSTVSR